MYLVVIVPPDDANGDHTPIDDLMAAIEKVFATSGQDVQIEVVT